MSSLSDNGVTSDPTTARINKRSELRKGKMTPVACLACRQRKLKCSGQRPSCDRCTNDEIICLYNLGEGTTRQQQLRALLDEQQIELESLRVVMRILQHGTDQEATMILARLRLGEDISNLVIASNNR